MLLCTLACFFVSEDMEVRFFLLLVHLWQFHLPDHFVVDVHPLHRFTKPLLPVVYDNLVNKFPQYFRGQFLNIRVFPYKLQKAFRIQFMLLFFCKICFK